MTYVERLVRIYLRSRERLMAEIRKRALWGRSTWHQEEMVRLIDAELKRLNLEAFAWAEDTIEKAYTKAARLTWQAAAAADTGVKAFGAFGGLHKRAIALLAHNTQEFLQLQNNIIARQAQDTVRRLGVEVTSRKFAESLTWKQTTKLMEQRLGEEGFYTVPWRNGRGSMRVDSYAELVARTTTAEATNTATLNQMTAMGQVLVKMTAHSTTCKVCASRQGRVYRTVEVDELPEGDPRGRFPHIREGMPRWPTYKTVHPNCAHRLLPFIWTEKDTPEQAAALARADEPFDHDPRGEAERKRYEDAQRKNRERLRDRKQWERYQQVLGKENTPKTLSAFRAMKRSGNENWQNLQASYRQTNRENAIIKAAKTPGERNYGKYANARAWSDKSVEKALRSYGKQVDLHKTKISNPAAHDKNWGEKDIRAQEGLLRKWQKDVDRNEELKMIMQEILRERGLNHEL